MRLSILHRCGAIIAAIALSAAILPSLVAEAQPVTLLHVNDTHSHLAAYGPKNSSLDGTLGGLPKVATIVAAQRAVDPGLLFVHAGDFMDGDFFFNEYLGVPELKLLQSIGLDAIALGNHEFGFGPVFLRAVLNGAWPGGGGVPVLGTNISNCSQIAPWNPGTLIKNVNGVTIGLFGVTTPSGALARPAPCVIEPDLVAVATTTVASLRASGAQVIIALSHAGMDNARLLASTVPGIDVIVNGHDNALLAEPEVVDRPGGGVTRIVSAGKQYGWVGRLQLSFSGSTVDFVDYALIPVDAGVSPDPTVQAVIETLKTGIVARYGDVYHDPLAWAKDVIAPEWDERHAKRDTPLGNLFTDAYRAWTGTDVAVEALGLLGDPLPAGWIVGADVFRAMSFGIPAMPIVRPYRLVTFKATGSALVGALEKTIELGGDYFPQVSGMRLDFDSRRPSGTWILLHKVHVAGKKIALDKLYSVTVTQGVFSALTNLGMVMQDVVQLPDLAFTAARDLVEAQGELKPKSSNRIRDVGAKSKD